MRRMAKITVVISAAMVIATAAYCQGITIDELVDQFQHGTDLQKQQLEDNYLGKKISARGLVENVSEYNFFDINTDTGENYFRVITYQQETTAKTPYQVIFIYKNKDRLKDISRGEVMDQEGTIINIVDERLQISVWIYEDELTPRDKMLFRLESAKGSLS